MGTAPGTDPRAIVIAPVRHALTVLVVRGIALVGAVGTLAVWIVAANPDATGRDVATVLAIVLLAVYCTIARGLRMVRGRPALEDREIAWDRARELDRDETTLAELVVAWVPAAVFLALAVLLWPHLSDTNPRTASAWAVFGVGGAGAVWLLMVATWLDAVKDDLARAEHESDRRFRRYWSDLRR